MIINISQARNGQWDYVEREIRELTAAAHHGGAKLKVIFENACHDDPSKIRLCEISGVDWVKTSTGYASSGAPTCNSCAVNRPNDRKRHFPEPHALGALRIP